MQDQPTVSVIMPTYNRAYIIRRAIESVLAQQYTDWELIVIDDGSTDDTRKVIENITDSRIHYLWQENAGPAIARNNGVRQAKGTYIAYLDSDNELLPEYLEVMVDAFRRSPQALYGAPKGDYTFELFINNQLIESINKTDQFPESLTIQDIFHRKIHFDMNGFMHTRAIFADSIQFDHQLPGLEDWDLIMQMGTKYPDGFLYVPEILYTYHQRYGSDGLVANSGVQYKDVAKKFEVIYQKHKNSPLMQGQQWHPDRVQKYQQLEVDYQAGLIPPYYLYPFPDHWPKQ